MNDRFMFRAKRIDNNRFVYGYLCFIYIDNKEHCRIYSPDDVMSYDCYAETLGQCTGLMDKNGKLIYEGDIVKGKATIGEGGFEYLGRIEWYYQSELIGWYIEDKDGGAWELKQAHAKISVDNITGEVIGNIHENADLLGEDK